MSYTSDVPRLIVPTQHLAAPRSALMTATARQSAQVCADPQTCARAHAHSQLTSPMALRKNCSSWVKAGGSSRALPKREREQQMWGGFVGGDGGTPSLPLSPRAALPPSGPFFQPQRQQTGRFSPFPGPDVPPRFVPACAHLSPRVPHTCVSSSYVC